MYLHIAVKFFNDYNQSYSLFVPHILFSKKKKKGILDCWSHSLKPELDQISQGIFFSWSFWALANVLLPVLEIVHVTFSSVCGRVHVVSSCLFISFTHTQKNLRVAWKCVYFVFRLFNLYIHISVYTYLYVSRVFN